MIELPVLYLNYPVDDVPVDEIHPLENVSDLL